MKHHNDTYAWLKRYGRAADRVRALSGTDLHVQAQKDCKQILDETVRAIDDLEDSKSAHVLYMRFVRRMDWDDIIKETTYSRSAVFRHYDRGLEKLRTDWD